MFCRNSLKLRITVQPVMQKARVVEPKTQHSFVDSHESNVGKLVWWAWPQQFARCIDLKCCKFFGPTLMASSWAGEVFPSIPLTSPSRPTLGLEVIGGGTRGSRGAMAPPDLPINKISCQLQFVHSHMILT